MKDFQNNEKSLGYKVWKCMEYKSYYVAIRLRQKWQPTQNVPLMHQKV